MHILPYIQLARLDKPWAIFLIVSPILWSYLHALYTLGETPQWQHKPMGSAILTNDDSATRIASSKFQNVDKSPMGIPYAFLFWTIAVLLARSASCVINDWWDADFDKHVQRCKSRPIAQGSISPTRGFAFYMVLTIASILFVRGCNALTIKLWAFQLLCGSLYPTSKRWCLWPQAILALTFGLGSFTGWAYVKGTVDLQATLPLFVASSAWCLLFDTIYALPDREFDQKLGLNSTTIQFQNNIQLWLSSIGILSISGFALSNLQHPTEKRLGSWLALCLIAFQYGSQIYTLNAHDHLSNSRKFSLNLLVGVVMTLGLMYDVLGLQASLQPFLPQDRIGNFVSHLGSHGKIESIAAI